MGADRSLLRASRWIALGIRFALLTCLSACGGAFDEPKTPKVTVPEIGSPVWSKRYPSGLQVIAEQDLRTQAVAVVLVVGTGSANDPSGKEGLAHYVEHLAFRSRPDGKASFRGLLERAGAAESNAFTNLDQTVYYEVGPRQTLPWLLKLEGFRMTTPVAQISPENYGVELNVVRNELRQRAETGYVLEVFNRMQEAIFPPGHAYTHPTGGSHASLDKLSPNDVAAFVKKYYRPENMTLQITGNVDFLQLGPLIAKSLPKELLEKGPHAPANENRLELTPPTPEPPREEPNLIPQKEASVLTPELWIGWSVPSEFQPKGYPSELVERILDTELSRLDQWDSDIVTSSVSVFPAKEASMVLCRVRLKQGAHPEKSLYHALDVLEHLDKPREGQTTVSFDEAEFAHHQQDTTVSMVLDSENLIHRGLARATIAQKTGDPRRYSTLVDKIGKLDRKGTVEFIKAFVNRNRARAVLFTPRTHEVESSSNIEFHAGQTDEEGTIPAVDAETLAGFRAGIAPQTIYTTTLGNGLQVVFAPRSGVPLVTAFLRFFGGVAEADDLGAAMGAAIAAKIPGGIGGNHDPGGILVHETFDETIVSYAATGFSNDVNAIMVALAKHSSRVSIKAAAWKELLDQKVPYIASIEKQPREVARRSFLESLFQGSKLGRSYTTNQMTNTTAEQVQTWMNEMHSPKNAVLVVVGEFDPVTMNRIVQGYFGAWMGVEKEFPPIPAIGPSDKPESIPKLIVQNRPNATQAEISFGCLLQPAEKQKIDVQHDLGAALLNDRLNTILREKGGASYDITVLGLMRRGGTANFTLRSEVESSKLVYSLSTIKKALEDFAQTPIDQQTLGRVKLRLAKKHSIQYMSNYSIAEALASFKVIGFPIATIDDYGAILGEITAEDIQADFKACFAGRPTFAIVGNGPAIKAAFNDVWPDPSVPYGN